jgi:hypothetical protein
MAPKHTLKAEALRTAEDFLRHTGEILKQRDGVHGDSFGAHARRAILWNAYLQIRRDPLAPLDAADVLEMMDLAKMERRQSGPLNVDNDIDGIGYSALRAEARARMRAAGYFGQVHDEAEALAEVEASDG